jgi:hypothetical protein
MQTIWLQIWRRSTLTTIPRTLRKRRQFPHEKFDRLQIVVGQIWPFNPTRRVCVLAHGHRTRNVQWMRDCGTFGLWTKSGNCSSVFAMAPRPQNDGENYRGENLRSLSHNWSESRRRSTCFERGALTGFFSVAEFISGAGSLGKPLETDET